MRKSHRLSAVALLAVVAAGGTLSACLSTPEKPDALKVVTQPEGATPAISLDLPGAPSGAFEYSKWPSACDLVNKEAIHRVLPGVKEVKQTPEEQKITVVDLTPDSDSGPFTVPEARCDTATGFDVDGLRLSDDHPVFDVSTEVEAAGKKSYIQRNGKLPTDGEKTTVAGAPCVVDDADSYTCQTENMTFRVSVDLTNYAQYYKIDTNDFDVDGKTSDYTGKLEKVSGPVAKALVTDVIQRLKA